MLPSFMVHQKRSPRSWAVATERIREVGRSLCGSVVIAATTLSHRNDVPLAADAEASIEIRHSGSRAESLTWSKSGPHHLGQPTLIPAAKISQSGQQRTCLTDEIADQTGSARRYYNAGCRVSPTSQNCATRRVMKLGRILLSPRDGEVSSSTRTARS
jgi:hypothetical protein